MTKTREHLQAAHDALSLAHDANHDSTVADAITLARHAVEHAISLARKSEA